MFVFGHLPLELNLDDSRSGHLPDQLPIALILRPPFERQLVVFAVLLIASGGGVQPLEVLAVSEDEVREIISRFAEL